MLASWNYPAIAREEFTATRLSRPRGSRPQARCDCSGPILPATGSVLNRLLHDSSTAVRREAIVTAGAVGYKAAMPLLIETLADKTCCGASARQALLRLR